jgi:hypothetical protein
MPLCWLCYRHNNQISVVIEPGASLIHARMRAALVVDTASLQATDPTARKTSRLHYRGDNRALALGLAQEGKNRGLLARHGGQLGIAC